MKYNLFKRSFSRKNALLYKVFCASILGSSLLLVQDQLATAGPQPNKQNRHYEAGVENDMSISNQLHNTPPPLLQNLIGINLETQESKRAEYKPRSKGCTNSTQDSRKPDNKSEGQKNHIANIIPLGPDEVSIKQGSPLPIRDEDSNKNYFTKQIKEKVTPKSYNNTHFPAEDPFGFGQWAAAKKHIDHPKKHIENEHHTHEDSSTSNANEEPWQTSEIPQAQITPSTIESDLRLIKSSITFDHSSQSQDAQNTSNTKNLKDTGHKRTASATLEKHPNLDTIDKSKKQNHAQQQVQLAAGSFPQPAGSPPPPAGSIEQPYASDPSRSIHLDPKSIKKKLHKRIRTKADIIQDKTIETDTKSIEISDMNDSIVVNSVYDITTKTLESFPPPKLDREYTEEGYRAIPCLIHSKTDEMRGNSTNHLNNPAHKLEEGAWSSDKLDLVIHNQENNELDPTEWEETSEHLMTQTLELQKYIESTSPRWSFRDIHDEISLQKGPFIDQTSKDTEIFTLPKVANNEAAKQTKVKNYANRISLVNFQLQALQTIAYHMETWSSTTFASQDLGASLPAAGEYSEESLNPLNQIIQKGTFIPWISGHYGKSIQGKVKDHAAYRADLGGFSIGSDFVLNECTVLGASYTKTTSKVKYRQDRLGDTSTTDSQTFAIYGQYNINDKLFAQSVIAYTKGLTKHNYTNQQSYKSSSKGFGGFVTLNNVFELSKNTFIVPRVGLRYLENKEKDVQVGNTKITGGRNRYLTAILGSKILFRKNFGEVSITPGLYAGLEQPIIVKNKGAKASITEAGQTFEYQSPADKSKSLSYNLGAEISAKRKNLVLSLSYQCSLAKKYASHQGILKIGLAF